MTKIKEDFFAFHVAPIDLWQVKTTPAEVVKRLAEDTESDSNWHQLSEFLSFLNEVDGFVRGGGFPEWEGDVREGPYIYFVPAGHNSMAPLFAWKQNNNGETFIVSRVDLPMMEEEGEINVEAFLSKEVTRFWDKSIVHPQKEQEGED
jgi:hypothetical protein